MKIKVLFLILLLGQVASASSVAITTTTLASGTVGWSYSNSINASGGCTPYTWATSGTIPPGLLTSVASNTQSLKLAGTPTAAGTYGFTATVTGCGGVQNSHSYSVQIYQIGVKISPTSVTLNAGATQQFSSTVTGTSNTSVNWSASAGSISTSGLYQAPITGGSYTVKAVSVADTTRSATAKASVKTIAVSISPTSVTLQGGATQQFTASVTGTTNTAVTWSATCGTVTSSGLYTAPNTAGTCSVTATSVANTSKKATATVTVQVQTVAVSVSPTTASINTGATQQFTATVTGSANTSVTWSTSGGTIDTSGLYTAPGVAGTYTVTATSQADGTKQASATVNVSAPSTNINFVQVAAATPQSTSSAVAITYPGVQTAGNLNIVVVGWNDTTSSVASVSDSLGNVYSKAIGPTLGSALAQSIYYAANITGGSNTVTVNFNQPAAYPDIRILEYSGANNLDVTAGASGTGTSANSGSATTKSPNELIFGANMVSTVTSSAGTGFTSRIITSPDGDIAEDLVATSTGSYSASSPLSSGAWVMQMVTFAPGPPPVSVTIIPSSVSLLPAQQQQFTAVVQNATNGNVTWGLTSGSGTVSSAGLFTAPSVTGCSGEIDTIQATSVQDVTKSGTATATIAPTNTQHTVSLSWSDSDAGMTFNLYRSTSSGSGFSKIQTGVSSLSTVDNTVASGLTYYYVVTAFDGTNESTYSNQVTAVIPCP